MKTVETKTERDIGLVRTDKTASKRNSSKTNDEVGTLLSLGRFRTLVCVKYPGKQSNLRSGGQPATETKT